MLILRRAHHPLSGESHGCQRKRRDRNGKQCTVAPGTHNPSTNGEGGDNIAKKTKGKARRSGGVERVWIVRASKATKVLGGRKNKTVHSAAEATRLAKRAGGRFQVWNRPTK